MDRPANFPASPDTPSSTTYHSSHSTPQSDCYSTPSALVGLGVSYEHCLPSLSADTWSQADFINLAAPLSSAEYPVWSQTQSYDASLSAAWSQPEFFPGATPHLQPSPVLQGQYTQAIPALKSSPCTSVSSRCNTPSSFSSSPQPTTMTSPSSYQYLLPQPDGSMTYYPDAPQQDQPYGSNGPLYSYAGAACLTSSSPKIVDAKPVVLRELSADLDGVNGRVSRDQSPSRTEQIQVMRERTKLVRVRNPRNWADASTESGKAGAGSKNAKPPAPRPTCSECNKNFSRRHNLDQHIKRKHRVAVYVKAYPCNKDGCEKEFDRMADLNRHRDSVHDKKKDWQCELCKSSFPRKDTLRRHFNQSCIKQNRKPTGEIKTEP